MIDPVVSNDREYRAALERVFILMLGDPAANSAEGEELARLAAAVDMYEAGRYPITCCAFAAIDCAERLLALLRQLGELYDLEGAIRWCESPQPLLDGQRPVDMLMTEKGAADVDAVVSRMRATSTCADCGQTGELIAVNGLLIHEVCPPSIDHPEEDTP